MNKHKKENIPFHRRVLLRLSLPRDMQLDPLWGLLGFNLDIYMDPQLNLSHSVNCLHLCLDPCLCFCKGIRIGDKCHRRNRIGIEQRRGRKFIDASNASVFALSAVRESSFGVKAVFSF